jgi:hypothetical protein
MKGWNFDSRSLHNASIGNSARQGTVRKRHR